MHPCCGCGCCCCGCCVAGGMSAGPTNIKLSSTTGYNYINNDEKQNYPFFINFLIKSFVLWDIVQPKPGVLIYITRMDTSIDDTYA